MTRIQNLDAYNSKRCTHCDIHGHLQHQFYRKILNARAFALQLLPPILILVIVRNNEIRHHRELMLPLYPLVNEHLLQDIVRIHNNNLESLQQ